MIDCAARRGAANVRVFGSVARSDDADQSDVDLLVDLNGEVGLAALAGLAREIGEIVGVDVVPADSLKPAMRDRVLAEAIPL